MADNLHLKESSVSKQFATFWLPHDKPWTKYQFNLLIGRSEAGSEIQMTFKNKP